MAKKKKLEVKEAEQQEVKEIKKAIVSFGVKAFEVVYNITDDVVEVREV